MRAARVAVVLMAGMLAAACSNEEGMTSVESARRPTAVVFSWVTGSTVVRAGNMNGACQTVAVPSYCYTMFPSGWLFYNDENDSGDPTIGTFVSGPATAPLGSGSVQIGVSGTQRRNLATYQFAGTPLASITELRFSTYNPSAGNGGSSTRSAYLQFNVDFDGSDTWQRRLTYVPRTNGTVLQDTWQEWDALSGGNASWTYSGASWPVDGTPGTTAKTWNQILAQYPGARIRVTDGFLGLRVGEPYSDGFVENIDKFVFGTSAGTATFDFEPDQMWGSCTVDISGSTYTLLADCTTSQTLLIPSGVTLDGNGFSITAVDPAGDHFRGAVVRNAGTTAHVTNVTITAAGLANICDGGDDRLRGILFEGAGGSIQNSTVTNVNQGPSGCQEGNAIEARHAPFDDTGSDMVVTISGNTVNGYIKNGITANGSVAATITNNTVTGSGALGVPYAAQNGIQVGFGATAIVRNNVISGNNYSPKSYVACGLLIYQADGVRASSNPSSGNERDVCNYGKGGGTFNPEP